MPDKLIEPRTLKGFRDSLPALAMPRERLIDAARRVFRAYGFAPIDTPALEYTEILTGKGGDESDKQMYRFHDHGGRDVALRFDLTVPFARFAAQHIDDLGVPFKRYHIAPVWRGENTQHGRYREFIQCDFDTIGTGPGAADLETMLVVHDIMVALGFTRFSLQVNDRRILNGLLRQLGLDDRTAAVLRVLDKLRKAGPDKVEGELVEQVQVAPPTARELLASVQVQGDNDSILTDLEARLGQDPGASAGLALMRQLVEAFAAAGIPDERLHLDPAIARGLDYYTGPVCETFLADLPGIGSVCSGGRYDNLAGLYTRQHLPGVGASLGLDRLMAAMEELGLLGTARTPAEVLVVLFSAAATPHYVTAARRLRQAGLGVELYPEASAVGRQLKYADRKGFALAVIGGPAELARGVWQVKNLVSGHSAEVPDAELVDRVRAALTATADAAGAAGGARP